VDPVVCPVVTPEVVGFVPDAQQQILLACEEKQVILNCTRQWGKSSVTALRAAMVATREAEATVVAMSPSARQSGEFLRKVREFLERAGLRGLRKDGVNPMSIVLPNASRIVALPGVEGTMRGYSAVDLLIVDEAAQVRDGQYYAAGPMLAVRNGAVWLLSTPYGARGFFWKEWEMGGAGWFRMQAKASDCPRLGAAFLERERLRLNADWYRQEYLCEFVGAENGPFREELLQGCLREGLEDLF
ncbi:terminase family protein, partial [Nostoc sp. NIES-2111]